ncbi:alanine racemase [Petroclostridium xylanilyticum]|uniref:alanine racemase n=1 Tax=Petroclostridium xylanilyticum TaxID=1792311 RepID=UPI000B9911B3|nr:alanine racemase [Petroclostridium xylanilyticum]
MSDFLKRVWAEVNLDHIAHNMKEIKRITTESTKILAVVKADAYGHGFLEVSRTLLANGADRLAVAFLDEAKQLRNHGIDVPILILGYTPEQWVKDLVELDITQTVYNFSLAETISQAAVSRNKKAKIHLKIDTGMTRLGFACEDNTIKTILDIARLPGIEIEGIFTHFASADEKDPGFTRYQFQKFMFICSKLENNGLYIPIKHVCNSAGIMQFPEMHLDMVRPGIILYGLYPSDEVDKQKILLKPAMALKAAVTHLKEVKEGIPVSYGRVYTTRKRTCIATVPVGYADGFSRALTGKVKMIAGENIVPVIGRICMDQCMIDVTDVKNINIGDEVVIFGSRNGLNIPVEDIAKVLNTINYEVVCAVGKRVPRVYIKNGEIVKVLNYII